MHKRRFKVIAVLIILVAFGLRVFNLDGVPPGLTHDEANHGREGISILDGDLRLYYPLNYGSEPLYSYLVAGSMGLWGENIFALRLVGVFFGTLLIALVYRFASRQFGLEVGLMSAGYLTVGYWPLVASRMALRATLFPLFMTLSVIGFWQLYERLDRSDRRPEGATYWLPFTLFVFGVAGTWYIYLAARITWLLFPLLLAYLLLIRGKKIGRLGPALLWGGLLTILLISPMFVYLYFFPESSTRLGMLDGPLLSIIEGDLRPLFSNVLGGLLALVWPGRGDTFLAYNIPGKPVLDLISAFFFVVGVAVALYRWRRPAYGLLLLWLGVGLLPSLITGATANTTRNVGALPPLFMLVGLGAASLLIFLRQHRASRFLAVALPLMLVSLGLTASDYFRRWANMPDVRGAYQTTLIASLDEIETALPAEAPVLLSTVYPSAPHDPSIALVEMGIKDRPLGWMDGRLALLWPGQAQDSGIDLFVPASTPLHPTFLNWVDPLTTFETRPTDLDPQFTHYRLRPDAVVKWQAQNGIPFNAAVELLSAEWVTEKVAPGGVAELVTVWRILDPAAVGPVVWPIETTDVVLFAQLLTDERTVLAQSDRLDAPSWNWQKADILVQVHPIFIPADAPAAKYDVILGIYDRQSGIRLRQDDVDLDYAEGPPLLLEER